MNDDLASGFQSVDRASDFALFSSCLTLIDSLPFFAECKRESYELLGAVAALTSMTGANATTPSPTETLQAASYADLLNPVPNAVAQLIADDAARSGKSSAEDVNGVQVAQMHHHHHHHRYKRRYRRHHHHHSNFMAIPRATV